MQLTRHRAREIALQILYQYDLTRQPSVGSPSHLSQYFEHFSVPEPLREFIAQLVVGTLAEVAALDPLLEKHAANWKVGRMSSVDRCLLRMATYEMLFLKDTHHSIVINEAVELAKQYGTSETPSFINGILDSIFRQKSSE